jgi:hypothetical protein
MKHLVRLAVVGMLLCPICGWGAQGSNGMKWLAGKHFRVGISKATGRLTLLSFKGGSNFLQSPVVVSIRDEVSGKVEGLQGPVEGFQTTPSTCFFTEELPDLSVQFTFSAANDLTLQLGLRNKANRQRDLSVLFDLGGLPTDYKAFLPGADPHPYLPTTRTLTYGYRAEGMPLVIPSATFYSHSANAGLTLLSPLTIPVQAFQVTIPTSADLRVARMDLRLDPQSVVSTQLFLDLHQPDWRPGLEYIRTKYPDHFYVHNTKAVRINGPFLWSPTATEKQVRQWHEQGVRWVEVHFTYPFLGKYAPDQPDWTPAMDDHWAWEKMSSAPGVPSRQAPFKIIRNYLEERLTPWENREKVNDFIRLLHRYYIKALLYWQPSECWDRYASERFVNDPVRNANGNPVPAWYEDIVLDPRPGSKWAEYVEQQFKSLLAYYPEADGIFEDQSHYDLLDYGHDDGFSIHNGKTAYRMGYAICLLAARLIKYAHSLGKIVWWNGPYQIELGSIGDGHLAEGSDEYIQWLGIGNSPITSGAWYPGLYDRMLLIGSQIASPSLTPISFPYRYSHEIPANAKIPVEELRDFDRYEPLFDQIREREWVLTSDAVEVPEGFEANIFRQPNGNYAVPVVTSWGGESTGVSLDVPVTVRVPDPGVVRGAYLLKASHQGWFHVPWKRRGNALLVEIPRHRHASLLVLAKTGFFAAASGDGAEVKGHTGAAHLALDNWFKAAVSGKAHVGSNVMPFEVKAGSSKSILIDPQELRPEDHDRLTVPIHITFSHEGQGGDLSFNQQFVEVPALEVGWERTLRGYVGKSTTATFYFVNHGESLLQVSLRAEGVGSEVTGFPPSIRLKAGSHQKLRVSVRPTVAGQSEIHLHFSITSGHHDLRVKFPVWRTRFDPHADVIAGSITFQEYVKDGMPDLRYGGEDVFAPSRSPGFGSHLRRPAAVNPRPVDVDGQLIGHLPSLNQDRWRGESVAIPIKMLREMGRQTDVVFHPANNKDRYLLRKVQIVLQLTDGSSLVTHASSQEYSTLTSGQSKAQPIHLHFDLPYNDGLTF